MHFESLWITFTLAVSLKQILTGNSQFFQIRLCVWGPAKPQLIESDRQALSWGTNFTLGTRRVDAMPFVSAIFVHHALCLATCSTSGDPVVSCPWVQGVRSARQTRNDFGHLWTLGLLGEDFKGVIVCCWQVMALLEEEEEEYEAVFRLGSDISRALCRMVWQPKSRQVGTEDATSSLIKG